MWIVSAVQWITGDYSTHIIFISIFKCNRATSDTRIAGWRSFITRKTFHWRAHLAAWCMESRCWLPSISKRNTVHATAHTEHLHHRLRYDHLRYNTSRSTSMVLHWQSSHLHAFVDRMIVHLVWHRKRDGIYACGDGFSCAIHEKSETKEMRKMVFRYSNFHSTSQFGGRRSQTIPPYILMPGASCLWIASSSPIPILWRAWAINTSLRPCKRNEAFVAIEFVEGINLPTPP